jgi:hypothetical protein
MLRIVVVTVEEIRRKTLYPVRTSVGRKGQGAQVRVNKSSHTYALHSHQRAHVDFKERAN